MNIIDDLKLQYKMGGIAIKLIFWNVVCFLVSLLFFYQFKVGAFDFPTWIALSSEPSNFIVKPWTFLTYAFFHDGFWHLLFNMVVLNFSSTLFLTFFTPKQYLGLYVLSAIFAGIAFVAGYYFLNLSSSIVGASAAIMAVLVATTTYHPLMNLRLLLIGNVKLWHITFVIILIDLMQFRLGNTGGHISHLSGAFFGFIFIKLLKNGIDLSKIVSRVFDFFTNLFKKSASTPFKRVHKNYSKPVEKSSSRIITKDKAQQQIDEILDKISQSGYDSLTKEEKEFLFKAGK
ncbi:rhomboid family intramembrane serine protease [Flavobacterium gawalongense]|uniref:Rhomboid family intramembrane serine protease n=1 Tax=Flavobacterium gawalongense TaxID=2594432 RepID=A0A553BZ26_9FLAO|nr:rhomboid family intramembrane serine protease [Flavobacterium gawalongense]TRX04640.1 rhomboid family intramembrane serine protease [Flavobacterium gawalongense]TRX10527.1 rhomboid family intramembrane serine protease [Flavobacterium gawalongense]TRX13570.1 rhomboid family intramembrane serine protease [Flavobacterium gawalongense]TRX15498.1 rhomboid family intramembrane serine protease [Flavobacterium gawalongense]TRX31337.1 rhomboid family intramembrane serine protease [Flavobacterium gaw